MPDASRLKRDRYRKRLNELLGMAVDEEFFQLAWAIDALQSGRGDAARRFIRVPAEVGEPAIESKYYVGQWDAETLLNEILRIPKDHVSRGRLRKWDCTHFMAIAEPVNNLRNLENAESGLILKRLHILNELPRIAYRQFDWQRGYMNQPQFYRWHYLFGGDECRRHFAEKWGLTIPEFALVGFGLFSHFASAPVSIGPLAVPELDLTPDTARLAVHLMAIRHDAARREALNLRRKPYGVAYQPSLFRRRPIVQFADRLRAPLPDLILSRVTDGIYYDVVDGPSRIRNEIGRRFEEYCRDFLTEFLKRPSVDGQYRYKWNGNVFDTPDLIIRRDGQIAIVAECKAKKMTFEACFSEDPLREAEVGFDELAKGVFQVWRFFSHLRRGVVHEGHAENVTGMVITLDNWLRAALQYPRTVLEKARALAAQTDVQISPEDMRPVVFCPIEDLEDTLRHGTERSFHEAVIAAAGDRFSGWSLPNIQRELGEETKNEYPLHGRLGEVLPWIGRLDELAANLRQ